MRTLKNQFLLVWGRLPMFILIRRNTTTKLPTHIWRSFWIDFKPEQGPGLNIQKKIHGKTSLGRIRVGAGKITVKSFWFVERRMTHSFAENSLRENRRVKLWAINHVLMHAIFEEYLLMRNCRIWYRGGFNRMFVISPKLSMVFRGNLWIVDLHIMRLIRLFEIVA